MPPIHKKETRLKLQFVSNNGSIDTCGLVAVDAMARRFRLWKKCASSPVWICARIRSAAVVPWLFVGRGITRYYKWTSPLERTSSISIVWASTAATLESAARFGAGGLYVGNAASRKLFTSSCTEP